MGAKTNPTRGSCEATVDKIINFWYIYYRYNRCFKIKETKLKELEMGDGKIVEEQCPKCECLGATEVDCYWDTDRDLLEDFFISFRKCEGCGHTWERTLDRRPKEQLETAPE